MPNFGISFDRFVIYRAWGIMVGGLILSFLLTTSSHVQPKPDCVSQVYSQAQFESCVLLDIQANELKGIRPEYLLTIAMLETGYGTGNIYQHTKNYFSIKAERNYRGLVYHSMDDYRRYRHGHESVKDVVRLLTTRARYHKAYLFALDGNHRNFFIALQRAGYSEDQNYAYKLEKHFQLYQQREITKRVSQYQSVADRTHHSIINQALRKRYCVGEFYRLIVSDARGIRV